MATAVIMPKLGMAMEEGLILRWLVREAETVEKGGPLLEIETEKAAVEVEAEAAGVLLRIDRNAGETIPVTETIAWIGAAEEKDTLPPKDTARPAVPPAAAAEAAAPPAPAIPSSGGRVPATPAARRLARESGVDPAAVSPTGPRGEVKRRDVAAHVAGVAATRIPLDGPRRLIAQRMLASHRDIPSATLFMDVDAGRLVAARRKFNDTADTRLTVNDCIVAAAARALRDHPLLRGRIEADAIVCPDAIDIGIAVSAGENLLVPVLRGADALAPAQLSRATKALVEKARNGELLPDDCAGGVFTVTNLGMFGITHFTPIINPPQTAILGVGAIRENANPTAMTLSLTHDHRSIDGAQAARFLAAVRALLEDPDALLAAGTGHTD